jgi:hypothetical protein
LHFKRKGKKEKGKRKKEKGKRKKEERDYNRYCRVREKTQIVQSKNNLNLNNISHPFLFFLEKK